MKRTTEMRMPLLPQELRRLSELAYNLWFGWNDEAKQLFAIIDEAKWDEMKHNPVRLIMATPAERWSSLLASSAFMAHYAAVLQAWDDYMQGMSWFQGKYSNFTESIAYFSAEFGFHESLPIYSGGLGILAGDHCKSASDLGVPLIGVGLLYKKGYFRQKLDIEGRQNAEFFEYPFDKLPIQPVYLDDRELTITLPFPGRMIHLKAWQVSVGRVTVYLLDADTDANSDADRDLTAQLYGGNHETRIQQEIVLGIGGIRMLRALQITPNAYHINEGHAAFISLERIREYIHQGVRYPTAIELVRASTIFTTHTPVPAGHDVFPMSMFEYHLGPFLSTIEFEKSAIIQLGFDHDKNGFNMTYLALNSSVYRNGVSKLHGEVSRKMFRAYHGDMPADEVPINYITNGVHLETWMAPEMKELLDQYLSNSWRRHLTDASTWQAIDLVPDERLWDTHMQMKRRLLDHARANIKLQRARNGESASRVAEVDFFLNPNVLTLGFARRFATYKRSTMIFNDLERLDLIVNHPAYPVQFIFAGKSHPADGPGQDLIREVYRVSQMEQFKGKIVILENYDIKLARYLVQGIDVWLNNPKRPLEASGTSGMKAAFNGVINFSVLDGWWEEGYNGENGWEIKSNFEAPEEVQERENTHSLYDTLSQEIVPLYYAQENKLPVGWIARMKRCIQTLAPEYNTDRMVQNYTDQFYMPASERFLRLGSNAYEKALRLADFKNYMVEHWPFVRIIGINDQVELREGGYKAIEVRVALGSIPIRDVIVEAVYHEERQGKWFAVPVTLAFKANADNGDCIYHGLLPDYLMHGPHYLVRIQPIHPELAHTFEMALVTKT